MDWNGLHADENRWLTKHYTVGREGRKIDRILIHHNAGRLSIEQIYQVWQSRQASAHYQVDVNGRIGQLVHDADTAWHAGDWQTNLRSIGIEHANSAVGDGKWDVSAETIEAGAHLVAALCRYYGLGRPAWMVNVFPHSHSQPTYCPGPLRDRYRDQYMTRAAYWYDQMSGATGAAPATPATASTPAPSVRQIAEDGWWGKDTTSALQRLFGTPVDGVVSSQSVDRKPILAACTSGWEWTRKPVGSKLIAAMQARLGVTADGIVGPQTINALESHYGFTPDGHLDGPSNTVKAMQQAINKGRF